MPNCVYIVCDGKASSVLYWLDVDATKPMPTPKAGEEPTGTGTTMEAWTDKLVSPKTDTVEGGLYKSAVSTGMPGGNISVAWLLEADVRKKKEVGVVVGHAQLLRAVGSVLNPKPSVVQVFRGDGRAMGDKGFKCMYYLQFE